MKNQNFYINLHRKILNISVLKYVNKQMKSRRNIKQDVMTTIADSEPHSVFFISDFQRLGSPETIRKIFFQASLEGMLERISQGIYVKPKESRFGKVPISLEKLAFKIADRDHSTILPTGSTAANIIGLSTQIPMNLSYITSGSTRTLEIGNRKLYFRHASPKNFASKGKVMPIIIQGMKEIGETNMTDQQFSAIKNFIENNTDQYLSEDLCLAPVWIQKIIKKITNHETLATVE